MLRYATLFASAASLVVAHDTIPMNPALGEGGYPDCANTRPAQELSPTDWEENIKTVECHQNAKDHDAQIAVGCVGDSITAGVHSSGGNHTYPGQLQIMLDEAHPGKYKVTNLGACGSTMMKKADSPYWKRPQYKTLTSNKWDVIIIMLGTNDAREHRIDFHKGPNWPHNCTGANGLACPFAQDYMAMIKLIKTLGTSAAGPKIYTAIPPPLMRQGAYMLNQTVINTVFPELIPQINKANDLANNTVIDVFSALGGVADWATKYGKSCPKLNGPGECPYFCDPQSCDQVHPNNNGYTEMAATVKKGLGL